MTGSVVRPDYAVEFSFSTAPFEAPSWEDETEKVRSFTLNRGRQQALDAIQPGTAVVELDNAGRRFDPYHAAGPHYGELLPGRRGRIRATYGATGLVLPGTAGAYASTPDPGAPADLDVVVDVAATDWTPSSDRLLVGQLAAGLTLFSFGLILLTTGALRLIWTTDGTLGTVALVDSSVLGLTDGDRRLLRATLDVNNGGGSREVKFWQSSTDGATWTQIGSTSTGATTSIYNSTAPLSIGGYAGGNELAGTIYRASVSSTIGGTPYASPRFTNGQRFDGGASTGTDPEGNVWTLAGGASLPAATRDLFGGYVSGWPVPGLDLGRAPVELSDGFSLLSAAVLAGSVPIEAEILARAPENYWKLGEAQNAEVVNDSGSRGDSGIPVGQAVTGLGSTGLDGSEATALDLDGSTGYVNVDGALEDWTSLTVVIRPDVIGPTAKLIFSSTSRSVGINAAGCVYVNDTTGGEITTAVVVSAGTTAVVTVVRDGAGSFTIYVDGTARATTSDGALASTNRTLIGAFDGPSSSPVALFDGAIQHLATFSTALTAADAAALGSAGTGWTGDTITERVDRILDLSGWPAADRDLDSSSVSSIGVATIGSNALEDLRVLEASEGGLFYIEPDFTARLRSRYFAATSDRSKRARFTFTDEEGPDRFRFENPIIGAQGEWIRNRVVVDWIGGSVIVEDRTSIDTYGIREHSISTVLATEAEARSLGEFVLYRYSTPIVRISSIELNLAAEPIGWEPALDLEIGDRVRIQWTPADVGDPIEVDALVDGKEIRAGTVGAERATFWFSGADLVDLWIWDVSTWDVSTVWG